MPTKAISAPCIHDRPTLRPCGLPWIPAFAGRTAREAPTGPRATSPDAEGDPGPRGRVSWLGPGFGLRPPRESGRGGANDAEPCGLPWIPAFAGRTAREAPNGPCATHQLQHMLCANITAAARFPPASQHAAKSAAHEHTGRWLPASGGWPQARRPKNPCRTCARPLPHGR